MATNSNPPDNSNGSQTPAPNGGQPKPRATIMMKKSGSGSATPQPPSAGAPGVSGKLVPAQGRASSGASSSRRTAVQVQQDREALGLNTARPSEKIEGLEEAAKRMEKQAQREEAKRKSGGKMNANLALHVDDTGRRWSRRVLMGIAATILIVGGAVAVLMGIANRDKTPQRLRAQETAKMLNEYSIQMERTKPFAENDSLTEKTVKERLKEDYQNELAQIEKEMAKDREAKRNPDPRRIERRHLVQKLLTFKDGWEKPIKIDVSNGEVEFSSSGKFENQPIDSVKVRVRSSSTASVEPEKGGDSKPKKN